MSTSTPPAPSAGLPRQRTFLGHPIGLYVLFFTEMWERFSYYGMRALLILYMINYFKWSQKDASTIYKVYTTLVYVTPILGGFLADRYLGNRNAVIIGAVLMAIGHFLMAFEEYPIFLSALIFLILGNGMFKPNMSTQVGRLYPTNDGRRDAAYTIFYMGINLGAFLAPLACGWLQQNTEGGYHTGFTMAGIGMVLGLIIYLIGQPMIKEIDHSEHHEVPTTTHDVHTETKPSTNRPLSEAEAEKTPSVLGSLSGLLAPLLYLLGAVLILVTPVLYFQTDPDERLGKLFDLCTLIIAGISSITVGYICSQVKNAVRDRVLAILVLGVFVMFFWGAFEQAGNVLNIWADKHTNRNLTAAMKPPEVGVGLSEMPSSTDEDAQKVGIVERFQTMFKLKQAKSTTEGQKTWNEWLSSSFNPIPTAWFQSINALAIFVIAPIFAWMWIALDRKGLQPSIPMKMFLGLILVSASVGIMIAAAKQEDKLTKIEFGATLPKGITEEKGVVGFKDEDGKFEPFHAGRFQLQDGVLSVQGVLPDNEFERITGKTAPEDFVKKLGELKKAAKDIDGEKVKSASVTLDSTPNDFAKLMAKTKKAVVQYNAETKELTTYVPIKAKEDLALRFMASEPAFRDTMTRLYKDSGEFRISSWWLFWSYIFATLGELCLSPVGLSMVSKLAPARFATMLMGVWMLTSAFGNFAAGAAGEVWGTIAPVDFFFWLTIIVAAAALVLLGLVRLLVKTMHGVN